MQSQRDDGSGRLRIFVCQVQLLEFDVFEWVNATDCAFAHVIAEEVDVGISDG